MNDSPYSTRFESQIAAEEYENRVYSPDSYSTYIWKLQKPVLVKIIRTYKKGAGPLKLLDFACGTGRVLSHVENEVDQSDGIDISVAMTEFARTKCNHSQIHVGNLLDQPFLIEEDYDIITCFRFLLNAEPETRIKVLKELGKRLRKNNGILVANIHGNSYSIRSLALLFRKFVHNEQHEQMSRIEIQRMFHASGFQIIEEFGFGILPPTLYRTPLQKFARWVDKFSSNLSLLTMFSVDLLYVCKLKSDKAE